MIKRWATLRKKKKGGEFEGWSKKELKWLTVKSKYGDLDLR